MKKQNFHNKVFYKSASSMSELPDESVQLVVTSPPYFNVKDYSLDGKQIFSHSTQKRDDIGSINNYETYIDRLLDVWQECDRVLKPNGKLCINVPLMPIPKRMFTTHYNRHIFDLQSSMQRSILENTGLFLLDIYIWKRTNSSKRLMFGSYPYPRNFYAQNTTEFIAVYVKDGPPKNDLPHSIKEESRLTQEEWVEFTSQIWEIPIPGTSDSAFGKHPAIMPEEIAHRCIRLFSYVGDVVLDPFAGSGTTLKMAKIHRRKYIGYEVYNAYRSAIDRKLREIRTEDLFDEAVAQ